MLNKKRWLTVLQDPLWYLNLADELKAYLQAAEATGSKQKESMKHELYNFFESALNNKAIALGKEGPNWDEERKPIDTIIIHHTSEPAGITWQRLSAMHLLRLYVPEYQVDEVKEPIYSNHFRPDGTQVFYAYQWLIHRDGGMERLLDDSETGWQAGNWGVNCRSVAICFDNDYEHSQPSKLELQTTANLIKTRYPKVKPSGLLGHREVNPKTTCPGELFIDGWKKDLAKLLEADF